MIVLWKVHNKNISALLVFSSSLLIELFKFGFVFGKKLCSTKVSDACLFFDFHLSLIILTAYLFPRNALCIGVWHFFQMIEQINQM
jgi:hypothetical protein